MAAVPSITAFLWLERFPAEMMVIKGKDFRRMDHPSTALTVFDGRSRVVLLNTVAHFALENRSAYFSECTCFEVVDARHKCVNLTARVVILEMEWSIFFGF